MAAHPAMDGPRARVSAMRITTPERLTLGTIVALSLVFALTVTSSRAHAQSGEITGAPVRLVLPVVGVDAPVAAFDVAEDSTMPVPQVGWLVAWYTFSAEAGAGNNAVLAGHRDWQRQLGVFYELDRLVEGDEVWLQDAAGSWYLYTVIWTASLEDAAAPLDEILGPTRAPSVTLITCSGAFDRGVGRYVERRVVRAELVTVLPAEED